jgi:peptidoglycan/xylan/chitin deacetylase (PgdA/CDA1 family)
VILYYHGVTDPYRKQFAWQMECLKKKCHVVALHDIIAAEHGGNRSIVAITFDDAFENLLFNVIPVLKAYDLQASIFAPVGNLGELPRWELPSYHPDENERVMSLKQLVDLDRRGFNIMSHTVNHSRLTELHEAGIQKELADSKRYLESVLGHEVCGISYPYGAYSQKTCEVAQRVGYRLGVTIEPRTVHSGECPLTLPRFEVSPSDSRLKFRLILSGAYEAGFCLQRLKARLKSLRKNMIVGYGRQSKSR